MTLLFAAAAEAVQTRIAFAPRHALEAGDVVTVGWEGLPANVEELEFLLAEGDGEVVRLTPQFLPSNGSFRWTVPNLSSSAAVLQLRAGIEGEEVVLASSEPFVIRGVSGHAHVEFRNGEWWALELGPPSANPPAMHSWSRKGAARIFVRPRQLLLRAGIDLGIPRRLDATERSTARVDTRCGAPLVVPQRK
jgi:hypothetical protein